MIHLPSGTQKGIAFVIPDCWTPEQAMAVYELLTDLRAVVVASYGCQITDLMREQRVGGSPEQDENDLFDID